MDFTIKTYNNLIITLKNQGFSFLTFNDYVLNPKPAAIILRHDVDMLPLNSLLFAEIENKLRIKGTYYLRAVPVSWDEAIIKKISDLGHEVGYHYEDLSFAWAK